METETSIQYIQMYTASALKYTVYKMYTRVGKEGGRLYKGGWHMCSWDMDGQIQELQRGEMGRGVETVKWMGVWGVGGLMREGGVRFLSIGEFREQRGSLPAANMPRVPLCPWMDFDVESAQSGVEHWSSLPTSILQPASFFLNTDGKVNLTVTLCLKKIIIKDYDTVLCVSECVTFSQLPGLDLLHVSPCCWILRGPTLSCRMGKESMITWEGGQHIMLNQLRVLKNRQIVSPKLSQTLLIPCPVAMIHLLDRIFKKISFHLDP